MPYDWGTHWPGVLERHADHCPFSDGEACTCGPLGYIASIPDPDTGVRVSSPLLETAAEARAWRREQEWAVDPGHGTGRNGHGPDRPAMPVMRQTEATEQWAPQPMPDRAPRRHSEPLRDQPARRTRDVRSRELPAPRAHDRDDIPVSQLIERFLDAAEDGEARSRDGRPYSDDELAELDWALGGYVAGNIGDLSAGAVRGRQVFRLIDELEDAGMPRSRLHAVVGALTELFDYAVDLGLVRVNPATYVAVPGDDPRPRQRLRETLEMRAPRSPGDGARGALRDAGAFADNVISERAIWMSVKIVTLIFILIALVLVAESV
jgi:hypothetical protein